MVRFAIVAAATLVLAGTAVPAAAVTADDDRPGFSTFTPSAATCDDPGGRDVPIEAPTIDRLLKDALEAGLAPQLDEASRAMTISLGYLDCDRTDGGWLILGATAHVGGIGCAIVLYRGATALTLAHDVVGCRRRALGAGEDVEDPRGLSRGYGTGVLSPSRGWIGDGPVMWVEYTTTAERVEAVPKTPGWLSSPASGFGAHAPGDASDPPLSPQPTMR